LYDAFRELGLSEAAAVTAATCGPLDRPRVGSGGVAVSETAADRAGVFADAGSAAVEALESLGASVVGRDGGSRDEAVRSFSEALGPRSSTSSGGSPAVRDFTSTVAQLDPSLRTFARSLSEAGVRHVVERFDFFREPPHPGLASMPEARALELALAAEARAQRAGGASIEVAEVGGRVVVRAATA
jgi:hypothetical protein